MGLYNEASLIMYPSGYKSGKIYCQKPVPVYDDEIVVNGDFNTDTDWVKGAGWTISGGKLNKAPTETRTNAVSIYNLAANVGKTYLVIFTVSNITQGWVRVDLLGSSSALIFGNGVYSFKITATSVTKITFITDESGLSGFNGSIDNVSVREILTDDADLTFTRASTATRVNESGLIEAVASGVPRIDFTGGGCGKLLLEPQRTNLFLNSQVVSSWTTQSKTTVTSNTTNAPDDTLTADTIIEDNTSGLHFRGSSGLGSASTYTFSVFAKPNGRNWIYVTLYDGTADRGTYFDIQNGTIGTSDAGVTAIIQSYANGFYKCSITATTVNSFSATLQLATANGTRVYLGDNVSGVYAWGAQLELGTYPTSYIPTAGSTVTRVADASATSGLISVIGQTEGTIILDTTLIDTDNIPFGVSDGTSSNYIQIETTISSVQYKVKVGGVEVVSISTSGGFLNAGDRLKVGLAYKANDFAMYINGTLIGTDAAGGVPATSILRFARYNGLLAAPQKVQSLEIYDTRLTNAELEYLTGTSYNSYELMAADLGYTVL